MSGGRKIALGAVILAMSGTLAAVLVKRAQRKRPISLRGAVVREDTDAGKQSPIADVEITTANGQSVSQGRSDSSGFFSVALPRGIRRGQPVVLHFRHAQYRPLDLDELAGDRLCVARMTPIPRQSRAESDRPEVAVANVRLRYSVQTITAANIGSAVKTFQVANTGNVPCHGRYPCSPDGKWKAAVGSAFLDAGEGNEFRNARVSCIAGPCPFTRIESDSTFLSGRSLSATARNWSDTATFLLEAEVFHSMTSNSVRFSYPVIFDRALNFTLPAAAEGVSIEAELDGAAVVFPLGPNLSLSWAECNARVNKDQSKVYRCELKPGYRFP